MGSSASSYGEDAVVVRAKVLSVSSDWGVQAGTIEGFSAVGLGWLFLRFTDGAVRHTVAVERRWSGSETGVFEVDTSLLGCGPGMLAPPGESVFICLAEDERRIDSRCRLPCYNDLHAVATPGDVSVDSVRTVVTPFHASPGQWLLQLVLVAMLVAAGSLASRLLPGADEATRATLRWQIVPMAGAASLFGALSIAASAAPPGFSAPIAALYPTAFWIRELCLAAFLVAGYGSLRFWRVSGSHRGAAAAASLATFSTLAHVLLMRLEEYNAQWAGTDHYAALDFAEQLWSLQATLPWAIVAAGATAVLVEQRNPETSKAKALASVCLSLTVLLFAFTTHRWDERIHAEGACLFAKPQHRLLGVETGGGELPIGEPVIPPFPHLRAGGLAAIDAAYSE